MGLYMKHRVSTVTVKHLPGGLNASQASLFLGELQSCMSIDRPWVVLDCSQLRQLNRDDAYLLLCCLEETMKRYGDVKLSGVNQEVMTTLELTGVNRLFETFETCADAIGSFQQLPSGVALHVPASRGSRHDAGNEA